MGACGASFHFSTPWTFQWTLTSSSPYLVQAADVIHKDAQGWDTQVPGDSAQGVHVHMFTCQGDSLYPGLPTAVTPHNLWHGVTIFSDISWLWSSCCKPHLGWLHGSHSRTFLYTHKLDFNISIEQKIPNTHTVNSWLYMLQTERPLDFK